MFRYLHTRTGRRQSEAPGIRGTLGRNLKPRQEQNRSLGGKEETDYRAGSRQPTIPRIQEEVSSKSSTSGNEGEEGEYSARKTVEREGREVRREMRESKWAERGVDLPQKQNDGLVQRKSEKEGKTKKHTQGFSKRQSQGQRAEDEDITRRKERSYPAWSEKEFGDTDTRRDQDNEDDWGQKGKRWGEDGVWVQAKRGIYPTTSSESSDSGEQTFYAAVRKEEGKSSGRERQDQEGRRETYREGFEEKKGMRRGWTDEIEQGWRREMARTEDLERGKQQGRQWTHEKPLERSDAEILGYDTNLGAVPRDLSTWREPLEQQRTVQVSRKEKKLRSRREVRVDRQSSPDERYVSNIERWRGQDLEKEQERERLRLGSGAVTAVYKEHHYSTRA